MTILFQLFVVLLLARLFGEASHRLGQPTSVGEIVAGAAAATAVAWLAPEFPPLADLPDSPVVSYSAEVGIFTLILLAGVEMKPAEIVQRSWRSVAVAAGGALMPLALGFGFVWFLAADNPDRLPLALLTGVALAITALPASVRVLEDLGLMGGETARVILAAAVIDDVLGLILLAVLLAVIETGGAPAPLALALMLGKVALFFGLSIGFGWHIYPHIRRGVAMMQAMSVEASALVMAALAYGALAELLGLHWILGPFMAGMFFEPEHVGAAVYERIRMAVASLVNGVLGPLFFFTIGLSIDLTVAAAAPGLVAGLLSVAFLGKLLGAGLPAYAFGLSPRQAAAVGAGMCSRGAVELVILSIALQSGLIARGNGEAGHLFSALVLTAVVTTIAAPMLMRWFLRDAQPVSSEAARAPSPAPSRPTATAPHRGRRRNDSR
ncbi:MAG: cation:proton antiporter [Alphaproteobacteria bacterium]|nr:cation:proton antiporter [Alphaproteobacteria bacterium]